GPADVPQCRAARGNRSAGGLGVARTASIAGATRRRDPAELQLAGAWHLAALPGNGSIWRRIASVASIAQRRPSWRARLVSPTPSWAAIPTNRPETAKRGSLGLE